MAQSDIPAIHVWLVLWKAARAVEQNAVHSVSRLGLGLSDFAVLEALLHMGDQPVNVIGKKVLLTSGSIITAVDRLAARNLVRRLPHSVDKRARMVQLTEEGRRTIEVAFDQHADDMEQVMSVLGPDDRRTLVELLKKVGMFAASKIAE